MPKGHPLVFSTEQLTEIEHLYLDEQLSIATIAERFGVSFTGMRNAIVKADIERRSGNRQYTIDEHVFDVIDNELAAYWLGFIYADGCVRNTFLQVILSTKDTEQLYKLRDFLKSDSPVRVEDYEYNTPRAALTVFSPHLTDRLRELGILPGRPNCLLATSAICPEVMHHFIRGFFDGDGSVDKKPHIIFCGNHDMMQFLRTYFAKIAGRNPKLKLRAHNSIYYLQYHRYHNAKAVTEVMYKDATIWLQRKRARIESWPVPLDNSERVKLGWIKRRRRYSTKSRSY